MAEFNLSRPSKNILENQKRLQNQQADFLKKYDESLKEEAELAAKREHEIALSGARFGYASTVERSKNRINALREEIEYTEKSANAGMTEVISQIVENALLLDETEFEELNPGYKQEIRTIVSGLLREGNINENITKKETLRIMEFVSKALPTSKEGKGLLEADLQQIVARQAEMDINGEIKNLSRNISSKVASLMEKEQKKVEKIQKEMNKAAGKPEEKVVAEIAPNNELEDILKALEVGEITPEDVEKAAQNGEISEETYAQFQNMMAEQNADAEEGVEEKEIVEGEDAPATGKHIHIAADGTTSISMSNGELALNQDGSIDIQLMEAVKSQLDSSNSKENRLVRESFRSGLIESLAVNEAFQMIREGKEYNADLCLARAIMYTTITETMNELGLITVGEKEYANIISAAGGSLNEQVRTFTKKEKDIKGVDTPKSSCKKPTNLNEGVIATQYKPNLNRTEPTDLAERLRQKRLNKEND